jgi:S1-C subfamily serine protease
MRTVALLLTLGLTAALAQAATLPPDASMKMEIHGSAVTGLRAVQNSLSSGPDEFPSDILTNQISKFANSTTPLDVTDAVRGAKGGQIYRAVSPAVVQVATKEGFGSGSLLDTAGNIITNWHVVKGYEYVAVIFKPTVEGKEPTRDDIKLGRVVKYDESADLALVKVSEVPTGRAPVRLGDASEIAVGMDVHAIGHPTGEAWT